MILNECGEEGRKEGRKGDQELTREPMRDGWRRCAFIMMLMGALLAVHRARFMTVGRIKVPLQTPNSRASGPGTLSGAASAWQLGNPT